MKLTKEIWKAAIIKAAEDCKANHSAKGPSEGIVCAIASLRVLRDVYGLDKKAISEVIGDIQGESLMGFLCNASGAATMAGLKGAAAAESLLDKLTE